MMRRINQMTTATHEVNPQILEKMLTPITLTEMEEVAGGDGIGTFFKKSLRGAKCILGIHDYDIYFEHKPYCGSRILSRAVETCKFCGYRRYDAWKIW